MRVRIRRNKYVITWFENHDRKTACLHASEYVKSSWTAQSAFSCFLQTWTEFKFERRSCGAYRASCLHGARGSGVSDDEVKQKERRVDALALRAEEGRDKLRKAAGRSKYPMIRRYPNGETRSKDHLIPKQISMRSEPGELKHLSRRRKRKKTRCPK